MLHFINFLHQSKSGRDSLLAEVLLINAHRHTFRANGSTWQQFLARSHHYINMIPVISRLFGTALDLQDLKDAIHFGIPWSARGF